MLRGILEDKGEPVMFAAVVLYRNGIMLTGVETDIDGKYAIMCMVGDEIETSYIGYTPKRYVVTSEMLSGYQSAQVIPLEQQISKSYSDQLTERTRQWQKNSPSLSDSLTKTYTVIKGHRYLRARAIVVNGDTITFVPQKKSYRHNYNLDFKQTLGIAYVQDRNLHQLQRTFSQGRPINGALTQPGASDDELFSWGRPIESPMDRNNLITPSIFSSSHVKYDGLFKDLRQYLSLSHQTEKDIYNVGKQQIARGKVGLMKYLDSQQLVGEISFRHANTDNHNAGGYYHNILKSLLTQSPSFDGSQQSNGQYVPYATSSNSPRWLLENNRNRISSNSISLYLAHQSRANYNLDRTYSNAIKLELNSIDINDVATEGTIGSLQGYARTMEYLHPKASIISTIKGTTANQKTNLRASNLIEAQYLRFESDAAQNKNISANLYRVSPAIGVDHQMGSFKIDLGYQPIISSAQATDWLSSNIKLSLDKYMNRKYLDQLLIVASYDRKAKNQELFLNRANYTSQSTSSYAPFGAQYDNPLFLPIDLKNEVAETIKIGISLINKYAANKLQTSVTYRHLRQSDVIFPTITEGLFVLNNVGNFTAQAFEWRSHAILENSKIKVTYAAALSIVKFRTRVTKVTEDHTDVIISGFANLSKQFIEGQPIGVIVGSDYVRNADGKMIIGTDGFPTKSDIPTIIGDPTPWLVAEMSQSISKQVQQGSYALALDVDGQLGGDAWNGTQQAVDYYGVSQHTADQRGITNYIYEGVNINGHVNMTPVTLAATEAGLEGNSWTRYGADGVASNYIQDASYLRIKRISLTYTRRLQNAKQIKISLFATNLLTLAPFNGFTTNYLFEDDLSGGLQYFNQPITTQIGISTHFKI